MSKKNKIKFDIIIIVIVIALAIATIPKTFQEDTFYMIKVGECIYENGMQIIKNRIELFSWHDEMIYTYPHWLIDIVMYQIFNLFNIIGIYIFTIIIGIIIYLLIYYLNVRVAKNRIVSGIITIVAIFLFASYITARAQVITYICCILTILWIEQYLETGNKKYIIYLIIIPIILANCHAALFPLYFVLYLPYIVEYVISLFFKNKQLEKSKIVIEKNKKVKYLIYTFIFCIFMGLLTPLGDIPYTYILKSIKGNTMLYISEHQPVVLIQTIPLLIIFIWIITLIFSNKIKIKLRDLFMLFGMCILALISYKQIPIFYICVSCIINKLTFMNLNTTIKEKILKNVEKLMSIKGIIVIGLMIIIVFLMQYKNVASQPYINTREYPVQATEWLKDSVDIKKIRLFNGFDYGSYLLFNDIPVFIDGRADVYDTQFNEKAEDIFIDYMKIDSLQIWYGDIFNKYGITHILIKNNSKLNNFLKRDIGYKNIYNDNTFSIYEKQKDKK